MVGLSPTRKRNTRGVKPTNIYDDPAAVAAWRRASSSRAGYLAESTRRMLDLARIAPGDHVLVVGAGTGDEALDVAAAVHCHCGRPIVPQAGRASG
jgi:hypothetical protein